MITQMYAFVVFSTALYYSLPIYCCRLQFKFPGNLGEYGNKYVESFMTHQNVDYINILWVCKTLTVHITSKTP